MRLAQDSIGAPTNVLDPLEEALRLELRTHLEHAVACLQWRHQVVIIMRALEGRTYDIGAALDVPTQVARLWYLRARQRLQDVCTADEVLVRASSRSDSDVSTVDSTVRSLSLQQIGDRVRADGGAGVM